MAVPKKKMSKSRRDRRRAHEALGKLHLSACPQCRAMIRPHTVCYNCGMYRGVKYLEIKTDDAKS
ncbi:MAG: 50S ribosomal protein L32 [Ardenticatenales bacterium]|nr:50S ribosomal protein L32 [Ardenticatenales bacterium]